jgi:hypothetical protein
MKNQLKFDTKKFPVLNRKDSDKLCVYIKAENPEVLLKDFYLGNSNLLRCFYLTLNNGEMTIDFNRYEDLPFNSLEMVWLDPD